MSLEKLSSKPKENVFVENKSKLTARDILGAILIISLLGTWAFIIWDKNNTREKFQKYESDYKKVVYVKDSIRAEYDDAISLYNEMKINNDIKDSIISEKDLDIAEKKTKINMLMSKVNLTEADLREAKSLITSLKVDIEDYKTKTASLEEEKARLKIENTVIAQQRDKLKKELDSSKSLIKEKNELIELGSTLVASNFYVKAINDKGGKEKETTTARKVDKLNISFDLEPNKIISSGKKMLYIVVTGPDGKVVMIDDANSGITTTHEGISMNYTHYVEVDYKKNTKQTIDFNWKSPNNFIKGNYRIDVYNNGFNIGNGYVSLKKGGLF